MRGIFQELKQTISEDEVEALIITYDTDKSGMLEREEFMNMAREVRPIGWCECRALKAFVLTDRSSPTSLLFCPIQGQSWEHAFWPQV